MFQPCKLHDDKYCSRCEEGKPIIEKYIDRKTKTAVLWTEIKTHEQEYKRIQSQIKQLAYAQSDISFLIQSKLNKIEEIHEEFDKENTEHLNK